MGDIVDSGIGLADRLACLCSLAWRTGTTTVCRSQLYPPTQGLWIWLKQTGQDHDSMRVERLIGSIQSLYAARHYTGSHLI